MLPKVAERSTYHADDENFWSNLVMALFDLWQTCGYHPSQLARNSQQSAGRLRQNTRTHRAAARQLSYTALTLFRYI